MEIVNIVVLESSIISKIVSIVFDDNVKQEELFDRVDKKIISVLEEEKIEISKEDLDKLLEDGWYDNNDGFEIQISDSHEIIKLK